MQKKNCHRKENNSKFHYNLLQIFEGHLSRMVSKFLIIFIAAFAIFHYFSYFVSCSTSRNIALIIYFEDSKTINTSLISRNLSLSSGNGGTLKTNFYSLKRIGDSYQEIVNSTLIEIVQNNDFVISFLKGIESNILNEVLKDYKVKHFALSPEDCHLSNGANRHQPSTCRPHTTEHTNAIFILLQHLEGSKMVVLTSKSTCSKQFSNNVITIVKNRNKALPLNRKTNISLFAFSEEPVDMIAIAAIMTKMKIYRPKAILLICPESMQEIILQCAAKYQMLGYGDIWVIPEFKEPTKKSLVPIQLVTITRTVEDGITSMISNEQVILAVKLAEQMIRSGIVSQQEHPLTSTTPILNTLPCRSNSFSTVKVSAKTGRSSDWTTVYVKDQSSPYQFYSNSATVLSLFAGNQPVKHFRVVTIIDAPFTMEVPYLLSGDKSFYQCDRGLLCRIPRRNASATTWEQSCCIGHSIDLLTMLMTRLGISVEIYIVEDGFYGSLVNRSFNGMIGDVASGKADLAIAGLTITSLRSTVVDFTSPFIRQDVGIVTKSTKKELEFINWQFAVPIESNVIIAVFLGILLGTFLTYVLENQELVVKRIVDPKGFPPRYLWREGFTYYSGLTFQRDLGGKNPKEFGSRVVAIGFAFAMLVIMTTYTAVLTATKVTQKDPNPFLGVKDQRMLNPTPDFKFATVPSTSIEDFFKHAPDENFRKMYLFMQKYNVRTVGEGLNQVKSGKLQAFIHEYPFLLYFLSKQSKCELKITGQPIGQSGFALAFGKGSSWTDRFSYEILRLKESGALTELDKKWLATTCLEQSNLLMPESLSLEYFGGLVLVVAISFGAMFLMLPLEYAYRKYPRRPINAMIDTYSIWRQARRRKESVKARPKLKSVSSESNFANLSYDSMQVTKL